MFLFSNFHRVLNAVCFLLGNSPASELYMPTFRNNSLTSTISCLTLLALSPSHTRPLVSMSVVTLHSLFLYSDLPPTLSPSFLMAQAISSQTFSRIIPQTCPHPSSFYTHLPAYEDGTEYSETSAYKIQTSGNYPKESIQQRLQYCRRYGDSTLRWRF